MIYVECKPDATLVKVLTQLPQREIIHEIKGKYEVLKKISNGRNGRGMIDEDPGSNQPAYLSRMQVQRDLPQRGLKVLEDAARDNQVILLCPRLEEWIIRAARDGGVSLERYNLPNRPSSLHRELNLDLPKFGRLVVELTNTPSLRCLLRLLRL